MKTKIMAFVYKYLAFLARAYLTKAKSDLEIIWITWSVGKTSCRMIVSDVLTQKLPNKKVYTSSKNFNSEVGLVLSVFEVENFTPSGFNLLKVLISLTFKTLLSKPQYDILVLEYGIDKPWDMDHLVSIVRPNIWIMTKIWNVHAEYFEDVDQIWDEKFKLLLSAKDKVYCNVEDNYSAMNFDKIEVEKQFYYNDKVSWSPSFGDYKIVKNDSLKAEFSVNIEDREIKVKTNLLWKENAMYTALALDIAWNRGVLSLEEDLNLQTLPGRFSVFEGINESALIDSSYNASPLAVLKTLDNIANLKSEVLSDYKVVLALWDMRELWEYSEPEHKSLAPKIIWLADAVVTVGPEMEKYLVPELKASGYEGNLHSFTWSKNAWNKVKELIERNPWKTLVLFKWSQNTIFMEEAVKSCLKDSSDAVKLPRQSKDWLARKDAFFK